VQPLLNSLHVELDAVVHNDGVAAVQERGHVALHPRFIDATASRERVCSAQKTLKRKAGWRGPGSSEGAGGPSTPFSSRLPCSKLNARGASTPTNPRASDRTSCDNETQALPKCQSPDVADSSGRHETQVRGDDVHAREYTSLAGIGSAAEPGGWPADGGGCARQDKLVQTVLSEHADLGALHGSRGQPRQSAQHSLQLQR